MTKNKIEHRTTDKLIYLLLILSVVFSCTASRKDIVPSAEYAPYVKAYTEGSSHKIPIYVLN